MNKQDYLGRKGTSIKRGTNVSFNNRSNRKNSQQDKMHVLNKIKSKRSK